MRFLKLYFTVFFLTYITLIVTKLVFLATLNSLFEPYSLSEKIYAIFWGYRFDFAVSGTMAFLATLFDFKSKIFAFVSALLVVFVFLAQIGDMFYFTEASRHVGYEISDIFTDAFSLFMTALSQHSFLSFIAFIIALISFIYIYKKLSMYKSENFNKAYVIKKLFLIALTIFFVRGMWQQIPLNPWQANQIGDTRLASLSINGVYNMIFSLATQNEKLKPVKLPKIDKAEIHKVFNALYSDNNSTSNVSIASKKPNVIFFFLESWSATFLKPYGFKKAEATPNFDMILKKSLRPKFMVASGHRTTEGMFATLVSFQNPLGKSVAKTQLQDFHYHSIINEFNKRGYNSAFFQGTYKETSGTGSLANTLGFQYSYGKQDVKKRKYEENQWGVHDVDLYNFVLSKLGSNLKEPFVIGINGATTYDDKLPKAVKAIHFVDDSRINKLLNVFHFADFALGSFIQRVEKKYPNTVFVLFADHCGGYIGGTLKNYEIPFAVYAPQYIKPQYKDIIMSQRDIAPTIADLTLGDYKKIFPNFTGKSLMRDRKFFADYYYNGLLGMVKGNEGIELNLETKNLKCYSVNNFNKENHKCKSIDTQLKKEVLGFTKVNQTLLFNGKVEEFKKYRYNFEKK
ncbi:LTA synthase family protein [Sulfurimonas sp.]|uniref:LTA synthase family protein n=1 Tax=Sulfurimonas sp. TaxID=2022749 RepID=UPI00262CD12E|nr:alkaline phosphatase family protein [Sulfurimonas sp.]